MPLNSRRIAFYLLLAALLLFSCSPTPQASIRTSLYLYRFDPPAFVELSGDLRPVREIPFSLPRSCSLFDVFSAARGTLLLIELSCPSGQTVLFLDSESGSVTQPVTDTDSHFLAWSEDGESVYLKVDSLGDARVIRADPGGKRLDLDLPGWTYDLSVRPGTRDFLYAFSRGLGAGSELHAAQGTGRDDSLLYQDAFHYLSFARSSPDGSQIAFIKIPDSTAPFTVGELWVMGADGSNARKLSDADAGHGYAANWSPDGQWIAFVKRENIQDESADRSAEGLVSNLYLVNTETGEVSQVTSFTSGRAETPHWSPDGNRLVFNTVLDGRMDVQIADIVSGEIRSLIEEPACCPAWMRK